MASGDNRGQKIYLLASPQYASVPDPRQNVENNRGRKPFLHSRSWPIRVRFLVKFVSNYILKFRSKIIFFTTNKFFCQ